VQAKGMCNIYSKIITENFPNLEKTMPTQVQEASRTLNRPDQNKTNNKYRDQIKNIEVCKREKPNNIQK
jgi:hypothetical protein